MNVSYAVMVASHCAAGATLRDRSRLQMARIDATMADFSRHRIRSNA